MTVGAVRDQDGVRLHAFDFKAELGGRRGQRILTFHNPPGAEKKVLLEDAVARARGGWRASSDGLFHPLGWKARRQRRVARAPRFGTLPRGADGRHPEAPSEAQGHEPLPVSPAARARIGSGRSRGGALVACSDDI